jgi:hypothetical protein
VKSPVLLRLKSFSVIKKVLMQDFGVVKDVYYRSLPTEVRPMLFYLRPYFKTLYIVVKMKPESVPATFHSCFRLSAGLALAAFRVCRLTVSIATPRPIAAERRKTQISIPAR